MKTQQKTKRWAQSILVFPPLLLAFAAQAQTGHTNMIWLGYYANASLGKRWFVNGDVQLRTRDWTQRWSQQLIRVGAGRTLNEHWSVVAGVAWFRHAQYGNDDFFFRNEWRPWQELGYKHRLHRSAFAHRLRAEQRWLQQTRGGKLTGDYQLVHRLRYKAEWTWPLTKKISPTVSNEFMFNPAKTGDRLDQNRMAFGFQFITSPAITLQAQYINLWLWKNQRLAEQQNIFRLNLVHRW